MRKPAPKLHINSLLVLVLFAVFAVCILSVLTAGSGVYRDLVDQDKDAYNWRTAQRYVTTKVHQAPAGDTVSIETFEGISALTLREEIDGSVFLTRIYCFDGQLRELFCEEGDQFAPEDGEIILPLENLEGQRVGDLLALRLFGSDGQWEELFFDLRGGTGVSR